MKMIANYPIRLNGKKLRVGADFESDDMGLIECGAASESGSAETIITTTDKQLKDEQSSVDVKQSDVVQEPDTAEPAGDSNQGKFDAILLAIESMLKQDPERNSDVFWTNKGEPKVKAVEKLANVDVSAADVKKVWALIDTQAE